MNKKFRSYFLFIIRIIVTFTILYILFKRADFNKIKEIFIHIKVIYYFFGGIFFLFFQFLASYRWKTICESWGAKERISFYYKIYLMGFSLNTAFPGIIGGDVLRTYLLTKGGLNWKKTGFSVFLDRGYGFLGILTLLAISLYFYGNFLPYKAYIFLSFISYGTLIFFFLGCAILTKLNLSEIFKPLTFPYNIKPFILGVFLQAVFVIQYIFLAHSLNLKLQTGYFFVIIPVVSFCSALPISISGWGIREGTLSYFLSLLHYPIEYGISLGILNYTLILIGALPGLFLYLKIKKTKK